MGYVERNARGRTELRVHGVAGTAPESVLQHPHAAQVAGNSQAGFFRRWWEADVVAADTPRGRREAYSWGGLTSGDNTRALWLLLLPFMLLNVAFYMTPYRRPPGSDAGRVADRFSATVQRLLALSFTLTFTLTTASVAMDLVGWQCAAGPPVGDVCGTSWLGWLDWSWLDRPGRQVAVTALLPLAVVAGLWWLAGSTWHRLESVEVTQAGTRVPDVRTPLEDRAMWNGRDTVRRLRALHVAAALVVPGVLALAPLRPDPARSAALAGQLVLLAVVVAVTAHPTVASRQRPPGRTAPPGRRRVVEKWIFRALPAGALAVTASCLALAAAAPADGTVDPVGTLPWLVGTVQWLFVAQALLLATLLLVCLGLAARARAGRQPATTAPGGRAVDVRPAWKGLAMPATALLAWVLAGGFSAGVVLRAAQTFGTPIGRGQRSGEPYPLVVPSAYQWVAVSGLALGVVAAVCVLVTWWRVGRWTGTRDAVERAYGPAATVNTARRDAVARSWARAAALSREVPRAFGVLLVATVAAVVLGAAGFFVYGPALLIVASPVVTVANVALTGFVLGLLWLGRQAYRDPEKRRTVGIVWDLGTFWPRAVHPLAPPCYAERAIPDLMHRLRHLTAGGHVLLSCHSQGSVLGAAVLLQVERAVSARTTLLTYGSPLARLYGRFFPAYFSPRALERLGELLDDVPDGTAPPGDRTGWRWRNLHRPSDPIGGAVFVVHDLRFPRSAHPSADTGDVDRPLLDPAFTRPAGDTCSPPIRGHSNYFADPAFAWTADALQRGVLPSVPTGPESPVPASVRRDGVPGPA